MGSAAMETQGYGEKEGAIEQVKQTPEDATRRKEEVTFSVSHGSLTQSLQPLSNQRAADRIRVVGPNGETKKTKDKPLKEITNKLVAQPVILKSNWSGLKQSFERSKVSVEHKLNMLA